MPPRRQQRAGGLGRRAAAAEARTSAAAAAWTSAPGDGRGGGRDGHGREVGRVAAEEEEEARASARAGESKSEGDGMAAVKEAGDEWVAVAWAAEETRVGGQAAAIWAEEGSGGGERVGESNG